MDPKKYAAAVKACVSIACDEQHRGWNDRFLAALKENGLTLARQPTADHIVRAPIPTSDQPDRWPERSYIVPITAQTEYREHLEQADEPELRAWLKSKSGLQHQTNYLRLRNLAAQRGEERLFDAVLEQVARYAFEQARYAYGPER